MDPSSAVSSSPQEPDLLLDQLDQLEEIILQGLRLPLTGMVLVDEDEVIEALSRIRESFPPAFQQAQALIDQRQDHLKQTHAQGVAILQQARDKREQLIQQSVQEGEHRARQVMAEAAAQRDMMLDKARQAVAQQEQVLQKKVEQAEQQFVARCSQLEQGYLARKEEQDQQLEQRRLQALQELERINQEKARRKELAQREVEEMRQNMGILCRKAQAHCEELTRQAMAVRQEADHYARQVLDDLNSKLRELQQAVGTTRQGSTRGASHSQGRATATPRSRTAPQATVTAAQLRAYEDRRSA